MKKECAKASKATDMTKHMVKTLQIISIQHELAMATGSHIELDKMIRTFLRVCIARLKLVSAHIFLYRDKNGWPETRARWKHSEPAALYFTSIPSNEAGQDWSGDLELAAVANSIVDEKCIETSIGQKQYHAFSIPEHGAIVFCTPVALDNTITSALIPIFLKLSQSCNASILHESLKREMEAREQAESELLYQANHNETTDLANRSLLLKHLSRSIENHLKHSSIGAVLCIHLDQLHHTNDLLGHRAGDDLQYLFADFLRTVTRSSDLIGQIDAETYIILLPDLANSHNSAEQVVENYFIDLQKKLKNPVAIGAHTIALSATSGYTLYPSVEAEAEELMAQSEIAKSSAKHRQQKKALPFSNTMLQKAKQRLDMEIALAKAIEQDELALWWQPQYDLKHRLIGAEALLRWQTPELGFISPGVFIPLAEESDLILKVGDWVLRKACEQLAFLINNTAPPGFKKLSINVNARQLIGTQFVEDVISVSDEHHLPRGIVGLELTESTFIQSFEETVELITRLQNAGFECSLDDFGTGYSSLSYLRKLPVKTIKIDQSFIRDLHLNREDQAIARTIISLGEYLHREVIAEGVESKEELDCLIEMGCTQYQGYYFDRPLPFSELMQRWRTEEYQAPQQNRAL